MNNHILANVDTDSFSVCKPDQSPWTEEEKLKFIDYINSGFPEMIKWCDDGEYSKFLVIKSKNYVLIDTKGKMKIKGSALKDQKRPKALLKYTEEFLHHVLEEKSLELSDLYSRYVNEIMNVKEIGPWAKKLTVTDKVLACRGHENLSPEQKKARGIRANETKVYDAIKHKNFQEGDKIYVYYKSDKTFGLVEDFNGDYSKEQLLKSLYNVTKVFVNVVDINRFTNYSLKKNFKNLSINIVLNQ